MSMRRPVDANVLVRVSRMYYIYGNTQAEIAKELKISRSMVSILLTEAKERGIVEIKYVIKNPLLNHDSYSKEIEQMLGVSRCIVVPSSIHDPLVAAKLVAERAGDIFNEEVVRDNVVGIAWGMTCYAFMDSYHPYKELKNLSVVPLVGGSELTSVAMQINEMVRLFAEKTHSLPTFIYAPVRTQSVEEKELYMQSSQMQNIKLIWNSIDIAAVGVGATPDYRNLREDQITPEFVREFEENPLKPVGDISARRYNLLGDFIHDDYDARIIGIDPEEMRRVEKVIAIAAGVHKALAIVGALRTGIIDTFVCDENTARHVIRVAKMTKGVEPHKKSH